MRTTIFLPKINKVFLIPILQNLNRRSFLDILFLLKMILENDPLKKPKKIVKIRNWYLISGRVIVGRVTLIVGRVIVRLWEG